MDSLKVKNVTLREMDVSDLPNVYAIEKIAHIVPWPEQVLIDCLKVGYTSWVVENEEGRIVGFSIMSFAKDECHLLNICVDPNYQHKGYGRKLLRHLFFVARKKGAVTFYLEVRVSNRPAILLYEDEGFSRIGKRKDYYPTRTDAREDAIVLTRPLR